MLSPGPLSAMIQARSRPPSRFPGLSLVKQLQAKPHPKAGIEPSFIALYCSPLCPLDKQDMLIGKIIACINNVGQSGAWNRRGF